MRGALVAGVIAFSAAMTAADVAAQTAPAGSCLLPDGRWCWPVIPGRYGQPCSCPTPDGVVNGVMR